MHRPESSGAALEQGSPTKRSPAAVFKNCTNDITEAGFTPQAPSLIEIQIFSLARRCAISAPMASAIAPLIWGMRS